MKSGFLSLETHFNHRDLVRVRMWEKMPDLAKPDDETQIRYLARFQDIEAAQMHVQNMMHGALVNLEQRIYEKPLVEMIACVEADELDHARVWLDPAINQDELAHIESLVNRHKRHRKWVDLAWQAAGIAGLILLFLSGLSL
jgi:hypothetical protein